VDAGPVLVDITPHTLGLQTLGVVDGFESPNAFAPIIERNTPLPVSRSEMFGTAVDGQEEALISVYQGEHDDVRRNKPVGEFLLGGLADAERGNEIQVRFHLDLDGILTVTATERATGLNKRVVIESPMERFRRQNRAAARERLENFFPPSAAAAPASDGGRGDREATSEATSERPSPEAVEAPEQARADLSAELQQVIRQAEHMIVRGERLLLAAGEEDAADLRELIGRLRAAIERRAEAEIRQNLAELDDLVFYLQDA
jgi:molecular chaperone DnaK